MKSLTPEEVPDYFDWFAPFAQMNLPSSSQWTRETLDWQPRERGLLEDIDHPRYFGG
ncbi:MAG TPA: hypothetical protein VHX12_05045 [Acidisoma sp.]|nr:hypothetical protein [Acidisoma sp.]